jgi:hypothetical protein
MSTAASDWIERHARWLAPLLLAALVLITLSPTIWSGERVLSNTKADGWTQFYAWRQFGFGEIARGNLPLWNPHVFGGAPFMGGFQSALLYPPNWLHLFLPVGVAINWLIALHAFLAGYFAYLWGRSRGLLAPAALLAGGTFTFCGAYWTHIFAGHLTHLCVMAWLPIILLSIDQLVRGRTWRWMLPAIAAVAMQILGGHPQYVYYSALGVGLYALLCLGRADRRGLLIGQVAIIYAAAAVIATVQLWTGVNAADESVRAGGTDYFFASRFALPPMNLLTAIAPEVFGTLRLGRTPPNYWGLSYLFETSVFLGVVPVCMAAYVVIGRMRREWWPLAGLAVAAFIIALGRYTPLYDLLFNYLPGFSGFRAVAKFSFIACLCVAMLAGAGFDQLLRRGGPSKTLLTTAAIVALALFGAATAIRQSAYPGGWWAALLEWIESHGRAQQDMYMWDSATYTQADFITGTALQAAKSLTLAAGAFLAIAVAVLAARFKPALALAILAIAAGEWLLYAPAAATSFETSFAEVGPNYQRALQSLTPDHRVVNVELDQSNLAMLHGKNDAWGVDPFVQKRWAEFMFATQDLHPDDASQQLFVKKVKPQMMAAAACRYVLASREQDRVIDLPLAMGKAQLIGKHFVVPARDEQLGVMIDGRQFDPRMFVLLEREPSIRPGGESNPGSVSVVYRSSDELEVTVNATSPAIVLVTNAYSRWWTASPLSPGPQSTYEVLPANWAMQAIPVQAGQHQILLSYRPRGYLVGRWVSLVGVIGYLASCLIAWRNSSRYRVSTDTMAT